MRPPFQTVETAISSDRIYIYAIIIALNAGKSNNLTAINIFPAVYYIIAYNVRIDNIFQKISLKSGVNSSVALLPS